MDNASNNDTMIQYLSTMIDGFPGAANQTRCFAHTINLSAKAILKQFDAPNARPGAILTEAAQALADLAKGLDSEERREREMWEADNEEDAPLDRWVNLREGLTEEEVEELDESTQPVQAMLIKVCQRPVLACADTYMVHSCVASPLRSRIPRPSSSPNGSSLSPPTIFPSR